MIKVNCKDGSESVKEEYPCLKKARASGRIILFTAPRTGSELQGGYSLTTFQHATGWIEEDFQLYTGTIELSNEL